MHGIEADVILRNEGTKSQELIPVMAHPPTLDSDLTLIEFLSSALKASSIIKLDFKSLNSVELSLQMLAERKDQVRGLCLVHMLPFTHALVQLTAS